mgnify:FL=1
MKNTDYLLPALAAVAVAILFPVYWIGQMPMGIGMEGADMVAGLFIHISTLDLSDVLFLVLGLLTMYVYFKLIHLLNDQLNYSSLNIVIWIIIALNAIFTGTLVLDLYASTMSADTLASNEGYLVGSAMTIAAGSMILFGILDIILGIALLRAAVPVPSVLKIFAVIAIIQGVFEVSLFLSFMTLFIFPLAMIILAAAFMRNPDSIEVV